MSDRDAFREVREHGLQKRHEQRLEHATYTAAEVKVLTETASRVAYELGRKDAGEEVAERFMADARRFEEDRGNYVIAQHYAKAARRVTSQPSGAVSDERSGTTEPQEAES